VAPLAAGRFIATARIWQTRGLSWAPQFGHYTTAKQKYQELTARIARVCQNDDEAKLAAMVVAILSKSSMHRSKIGSTTRYVSSYGCCCCEKPIVPESAPTSQTPAHPNEHHRHHDAVFQNMLQYFASEAILKHCMER
jgi:hypothetical protein